MKAIILAAGRGSRLGSITENQPKCLTELCNKSLLQWQIDALKEAGIREIGIVRGYKKDKIQIEGAVYFDNDRWDQTNMVMSLYEARQWLRKDECIVSYSDIVFDAKVIKQLMNDKNYISISYYVKWLELWKARFENPLDDAETFKINEVGKLLEIGNKAEKLDEIEGQYMGLLKFKPEGWREIEVFLEDIEIESRNTLDMTSLLSNLIKKGIDIFTIPTNERWLEVDNQKDLNLYQTWYEK